MKTFTRAMMVAALGWTWAAPAEAPFSFDAAPGRLPKNVVPLAYRIAIIPHIERNTLTGTESVTLQFREQTATIAFNSLHETLRKVLLDGEPVGAVLSDDDKQLTTLTLAHPAKPGVHTLTFSYRGRIESAPIGLFAQPYVKPGGKHGVLLSTQFESTDARSMFPCWDEPAFRATYRLTATLPAAWAAVSNMPVARRVIHGALATTTFQDSPRMPSYLVEFSAGDLARIGADSGGTRLGLWALRGQEQNGAVALANAQQILADYNDYFGYAYPLPKLDSIAVPGAFQGAMENWGAITYNDQALLLSASSTLEDRQLVFSIQAHEMAHQWNGDLVTMGWWDDIWLNESFASWVSAMETDLRNPDWKWWEDQDEDKEGAMDADARIFSHPIQQHVGDELQAANAFDAQITYSKGQAVLRMFEAYLGHEVFRAGIREFIKAHAFSNASSADLWNALGAASGTDVGKIAAGWTEQPGFPLVSVAAGCDAAGRRILTLSQRRFLLRGSDPEALHWSIPLQIRWGANGAPQSVLLNQDGQKLAAGRCDEPLSANAAALGYYRVAYDDATLRINTASFGSLPNADRIALLDDQWALVQSGQQRLPAYLALATSMGADLDARAWDQIAGALAEVEYDERGSPGHDSFAAYARSVIKPVAIRLGWDARAGETAAMQKLRRTVLGDLGAWDDAEVVAEARRRFAGFIADRSSIRPDQQQTLLSIVARHADAAVFEQLHAIAKASANETELERYYTSLMEVRDPQLAQRAVQIVLSPEIPPQAEAQRLDWVTQLAEQHPALSWASFTRNADRLLKPLTVTAPLFLAQDLPARYWDALPLDQLEAWVKAHVPAEMRQNVARGMETARFKLSEKAALVQAADAHVGAAARLQQINLLPPNAKSSATDRAVAAHLRD